MLKAKTQKAEIEAACQRGELVSKALVAKQSAFLLLPMGDILNFSPRLKEEDLGKGCHLDEFGACAYLVTTP